MLKFLRVIYTQYRPQYGPEACANMLSFALAIVKGVTASNVAVTKPRKLEKEVLLGKICLLRKAITRVCIPAAPVMIIGPYTLGISSAAVVEDSSDGQGQDKKDEDNDESSAPKTSSFKTSTR